MTRTRLAWIGAPFAIILSTAACEQQALAERPEGVSTLENGAVVETKEVERPDIFSTTEEGLWDGRPSLGGVWVAHPDVTDPERVRITVTETGRMVTGALFKRERNNPGPRIQVSSDAAAALGMLGGQPATLEVVVLRTETIEIAPPPAPEVEEPAEDAVGAEEDGAVADAAAAGAVAAGTAAVVVDDAAAPARTPFWKRIFGSRSNAVEETEMVDTSADGATAEAAPEVETQSLGAVAAATAAIERAEAGEAAAAQPASGIAAPYIQVGLFKSQADADSASAALRRAGMPPVLKPLTNRRDSLWRVLVGPAETVEAQQALLSKIKSLGYTDAYPTAN